MVGEISIFWFRRDLRLEDNAGLYHALKGSISVLPVFIFDRNILDSLETKKDARVQFIYDAIQTLHAELASIGSTLRILYGTPMECFKNLTNVYRISAVYMNHDYEPYARKRDTEVSAFLNECGIPVYTFKDQVIFEKDEVIKDNGTPYTVYTPYSKRWKDRLTLQPVNCYPTEKHFDNFIKCEPASFPALKDIGFEGTMTDVVPPRLNEEIARHYDATRDYPAINGTSRMGVHLRFGTISIRKLVLQALALNPVYLNELIWREFYQMILWHFPYVANGSFKKEYDQIEWRNNEQEFAKWCEGQTGFPIVDAGMRQLNQTGYMHNRVRMIAASFLTKDLLVDWRWGEAYFAEKLLDYDLAANNGGWQWAAGCGCDAAPYFRIFNPELQTKKFDPELKYIKEWVPEYDTMTYVQPVVDHSVARDRCLKTYKRGLNKQ